MVDRTHSNFSVNHNQLLELSTNESNIFNEINPIYFISSLVNIHNTNMRSVFTQNNEDVSSNTESIDILTVSNIQNLQVVFDSDSVRLVSQYQLDNDVSLHPYVWASERNINIPEPSLFAHLNYSSLATGSNNEIAGLNKNDKCPISLTLTYEIQQPTFIQGSKDIYECADLLEALKRSATNPMTRTPVEVGQLRKININDIPAPSE